MGGVSPNLNPFGQTEKRGRGGGGVVQNLYLFLGCHKCMVPFINNINDEERRNDNIPLDVYFFYDKNMFERKKTFRHSKIQNSATFRRIIEFRNYLPSVNLLLKS